MQNSESLSAMVYNLVGRLLGPYYRRVLFPSHARLPDRNNATSSKPVQWPTKDDFGSRLHVIEYEDKEPVPKIMTEHKLFVYIHGRARSANRSIHLRRDGSPDTVHNLLGFGTVLGVNLPGYEESPLTDGKLKNAERDTIMAARDLSVLLYQEAEARGIRMKDIVIVGVSIGMYMSLCLASRLQQASVVLIVPPADLETVPYSVRGISLRPLIPWAARHAYPSNMDVIEDYKTTGFDGVAFLRQHGEKLRGNLHIFTAKDDKFVPQDAGERLRKAFVESRDGFKHARTAELGALGHEARPSREEWRELFQGWAQNI